MSKHTLSGPLPAAKRRHVDGYRQILNRTPFSFNDSLYDELVLCIFSHLSWVDLCAAQATSTNWYRLASDNSLWKKLYLAVFGRSRLRGARGYIARSDGREVRSLPGRVTQEPTKDWKWMFRISSNWKKGRCAVEELEESRPLLLDDISNISPETHVLLSGPITITASSRPTNYPIVNLFISASNSFRLTCESSGGGGPSQITALAIDQSPPIQGLLRLAVFLSSGQFTVFSINPTHLSSSARKFTYLPSRARPALPAVHAVYHHPLLVTLSVSDTFRISLYDLSNDNIVHTQTLTSFTSFPPSSLVLSMTSTACYKLVLAYTTPVYPKHWSVGVTELIISSSARPSSPFLTASVTSELLTGLVRVTSTRTTRAIDVPPGFIDDDKLRLLQEQYSRKVACVTGAQTDGKWVVLAPAETTPSCLTSNSFISIPASVSTQESSYLDSSTGLQLYRLYLPQSSNSVAAPAPKLVFVRSLHGQTGPIASLALADGRCVSFGLNGSLWVWDLEAGTGAEVSPPSIERIAESSSATVAFDERRIVTTVGSRVFVRRFDI